MQPFHKIDRLTLKGDNNIKLKTMKTTRIISAIAVIFLISLSVQGQSKKGEAEVSNFASYKLWVPGLEEYVKGPFSVELTESDNLDEFIAIGTGMGLISMLTYDVRSEYSTKYHGTDNKSATFNQVIFVRLDGKIIIKIMRLYQIKIDEFGGETITVEKSDIFDYR